jgi:hypothetical protein
LYFSSVEEIKAILNQYTQADKRMMEQNLEKIRTQYGWDKIIEQYENLFIDAISQKKNVTEAAHPPSVNHFLATK